ncbi:hypothetical protein GX48_08173 [Paracoccidioides brasiliensis]|nr:hypothetical protein GX48_08173 [Paracoccidioides brasiliensis]
MPLTNYISTLHVAKCRPNSPAWTLLTVLPMKVPPAPSVGSGAAAGLLIYDAVEAVIAGVPGYAYVQTCSTATMMAGPGPLIAEHLSQGCCRELLGTNEPRQLLLT